MISYLSPANAAAMYLRTVLSLTSLFSMLTLIEKEITINREVMSSGKLANIDNKITLPGEVYPRQVSVIDISKHVEPCCGTHLHNSKDVGSFVVTSVKTPSSGVKSVKCLTGIKAFESKLLAKNITREVADFGTEIEKFCTQNKRE